MLQLHERAGSSAVLQSHYKTLESNGTLFLPGELRIRLLAQELAGLVVDEVKTGAGRADDLAVRSLRLIVGRVGQPVLHPHAGLGAFEQNVSCHAPEYDDRPGPKELRMFT